MRARLYCRPERVKCIEHVHNEVLQQRYALWKEELRDKNGEGGVNEMLLFHGADKATLEAVINEEFDIRVTNQGSLGTGEAADLLFWELPML